MRDIFGIPDRPTSTFLSQTCHEACMQTQPSVYRRVSKSAPYVQQVSSNQENLLPEKFNVTYKGHDIVVGVTYM